MISGSYWKINHFKYMFAENIIIIIVIPSKNNSKQPLQRIKTTHRDNHTLNHYTHKNNHSPDLFKLTIQHRSIYIKGIIVWGRVQIAGISIHLPWVHITFWWARWRLKSPALWLFTQPSIHAQIKKKHQSSASLAFIRGIHRWPTKNDVRERKALASY